MIELLSIQKFDVERKIEVTLVTISKLSLGAQHLDEMLIGRTYGDMRALGYINDQVIRPFLLLNFFMHLMLKLMMCITTFQMT